MKIPNSILQPAKHILLPKMFSLLKTRSVNLGTENVWILRIPENNTWGWHENKKAAHGKKKNPIQFMNRDSKEWHAMQEDEKKWQGGRVVLHLVIQKESQRNKKEKQQKHLFQ